MCVPAKATGNYPENAYADAAISGLFEAIRSGDVKSAVTVFFDDAKRARENVGDGKPADIKGLSDAMTKAVAGFGAMGECEILDREMRGTMVEYRTYLCQHTAHVSYWNFAFVRTTNGWIPAMLNVGDAQSAQFNLRRR